MNCPHCDVIHLQITERGTCTNCGNRLSHEVRWQWRLEQWQIKP